MRWASAVSDNQLLDDAVRDAAGRVREQLGDGGADLTLVFVSAHHASQYARVSELVSAYIESGTLIGCSGGGVIVAGREVEHRNGFAITSARLPDVISTPFYVENGQVPDADAPQDSWERLVGVAADNEPSFVLLADPWSIDVESMVRGLDYAFPDSSKVGGLASGASQPGGNALFVDDKTYTSGMAGVAMSGDVAVDTVVAQGCKPIGRPMQVTACNQNVLLELDGRTALDALRDVVNGLGDEDRELVRHSLFLGVVMDPLNDSPRLGDYLVRNIVGADHGSGVLAIGEMLREGQTVQFHLRDAETSAKDLGTMLESYVERNPIYEETGALLFTCLGRGEYLYGRPDHDTDMFRDRVNSMPLTGFFCNGEIGPVGGSTYLHGYTSSFGIFRHRRGS